MQEKITILGAGLVGSLLATRLGQRGFSVEVYERRGDLRGGNAERGRSINLALSNRGLYSLSEVGLQEEVLKRAISMRGRFVHLPGGQSSLQRYGKKETDCIYSISRNDLNGILLSQAEKSGQVKVNFNHKVNEVDLKGEKILVSCDSSGASSCESGFSEIPFQVLMGADGAQSVLRGEIEKETGTTVESLPLGHGYKELLLPPTKVAEFALDPHALHIWPRKSFMLIALPNEDKSFTCTLFLPWEGENSFAELDSASRLTEFFKNQFPDVMNLIPDLTAQFFENPTGKMITVKAPQWHSGRACLLGDAAHAIVPFFGQGMNCGFEDVSVMGSLLEKHQPSQPNEKSEPNKVVDWKNLFREFHSLRKNNTDAIAQMAVENFVEMRDKVSDPQFLLKKEIEKILLARFPTKYVNRYQLVTFSRVPYQVALEAGKIQEGILDKLMEGIPALDQIDSIDLDLAESLIEKNLIPSLKEYR